MIADVELFLKEVDALAIELRDSGDSSSGREPDPESFIGAAIASMPGTDHCNHKTLTQLSKSVPILVYGVGTMELVKNWNYFETVIQIAHFTGDWRDCPPWKCFL